MFLLCILCNYIYAIFSRVGDNWININKLFQTFLFSIQPLGHFNLKQKRKRKHMETLFNSYRALRQKNFLIFKSSSVFNVMVLILYFLMHASLVFNHATAFLTEVIGKHLLAEDRFISTSCCSCLDLRDFCTFLLSECL